MPNQPVSVITNGDHRSHDPEYDVYSGTIVGRFEVPQRVDCIVQALDGGPFETVDSTSHGMEPILRVHNPDLVDFLSTAWKDYITVLPDAQAVIAEMFIHPGLVEAMPVGRPPVTNAYGRLGWFCFDTSSPLSEGSWPAAWHRSTSHCRGSIACWPASGSCTRCAARPGITPPVLRSAASAC